MTNGTSCPVPMLPPPEPCVIVIFGVTGDLTRRKLIPALFDLCLHGLLPSPYAIIGIARARMDDDAFRHRIREEFARHVDPAVRQNPDNEAAWDEFIGHWHYVPGDARDASTHAALKVALRRWAPRQDGAIGNVLFYMATGPEFFLPVARLLHEAGLARPEEGAWRRFIFEKPFGRDLASARALNEGLAAILDESQVYRIDHYLGKETVQNIMVFRFANGIFEPLWNRNHVASVHITVSETVGVGDRGGYYDVAGALRDMVPNHLFQLLALVAMEAPSAIAGDAVRDEKTKVFRAIRPVDPERVTASALRGQYGPGTVEGQSVPGYRDEPKVARDSRTETFVSLRLWVDNWRWADVPFHLCTGKRLAERSSHVVIRFRDAPLPMFRGTACQALQANELVMTIQPEECMTLRFNAKVPGPALNVDRLAMDVDYAKAFGKVPQTGYETLLYDAMTGDQTLYMRADQVEAAWAVVDPILRAWHEGPADDMRVYPAGSRGPGMACEVGDGNDGK